MARFVGGLCVALKKVVDHKRLWPQIPCQVFLILSALHFDDNAARVVLALIGLGHVVVSTVNTYLIRRLRKRVEGQRTTPKRKEAKHHG